MELHRSFTGGRFPVNRPSRLIVWSSPAFSAPCMASVTLHWPSETGSFQGDRLTLLLHLTRRSEMKCFVLSSSPVWNEPPRLLRKQRNVSVAGQRQSHCVSVSWDWDPWRRGHAAAFTQTPPCDCTANRAASSLPSWEEESSFRSAMSHMTAPQATTAICQHRIQPAPRRFRQERT